MEKNKKMLAVVVAAILVIGGGAFAINNSSSDKKAKESKAAETVAMEKKKVEEAAMEKDKMAKKEAETAAMEKDKATTGDVMVKEDAAMAKHGSYVTLADYQKDTAKYAESKKIYFFHASWCPDCRAIEKEINADISKLPAKTVFIKTDFDNSKELRQKYGVTVQHTFVQVDENGNSIQKWSATNLDKVVAGIKA